MAKCDFTDCCVLMWDAKWVAKWVEKHPLALVNTTSLCLPTTFSLSRKQQSRSRSQCLATLQSHRPQTSSGAKAQAALAAESNLLPPHRCAATSNCFVGATKRESAHRSWILEGRRGTELVRAERRPCFRLLPVVSFGRT